MSRGQSDGVNVGDLAPLTSLLIAVISVGGIVALAVIGHPVPEALVYIATGATVGIPITSAIRGSTPKGNGG